MTVTGGDRSIGPATMIKPVFDAAISAFHVHNELIAMKTAIARLASAGRGDVATLEDLLTDTRFNLLGARNLLSPYRDGVKWNPEDERCVAGELLWITDDGPKRFSGELFEVLPRAS